MDSVPLVGITGQVATSMIGTDAFQEADISGITLRSPSTTSWSPSPRTSPHHREAFHVASTGRPGRSWSTSPRTPCSPDDFSWPVPFDLPGYHPVTRPHARQVREAAG